MAELDPLALDIALRKLIYWLCIQTATTIDLAALKQYLSHINIEVDALAVAPNASPETRSDTRSETARVDLPVFDSPPADSLAYAYYFDAILRKGTSASRAAASECSLRRDFSDPYVYGILARESYGLEPDSIPICELLYPDHSLGCLVWDSAGIWDSGSSDDNATSSPSVFLRTELIAAGCLLYQQITLGNTKTVGPRRYLRRPAPAHVQATVITFLPRRLHRDHELSRAVHLAIENASDAGQPGLRLRLRRLGELSLRVPGSGLPTFPAPATVTEILRWAGQPDPFCVDPSVSPSSSTG
ncbi:hypothetical protein TPAR_04583 [Tolypocladium paradoxum]|uniref:Uncharacterized protein n=1 Tax=Tolypocladium paradoxum TaxID=94208 RepID=A0A2S4KYJ0_9HYPO|nr:hypothetical protein TPAR_04583 [Tolypocladium paradoxum]